MPLRHHSLKRGIAAMKKHLLEAAERGDAAAQFNLSIMCENGFTDSRHVTEGNRPEAMRWLQAAAEQGLPRAQIRLADIYAGEATGPEGVVIACGWYLLAAAGLSGAQRQTAQAAYQRLSDRLTPEQDAEATRFAQEWKAKVSPAATETLRNNAA